jgi:hypothetical protein
MGNIGQPVKEVEFEPVPDSVPVPEIVPVPVREPVPAGYLERIASLPDVTVMIIGYFE